jgi:hypothetical protein
LEAGMEQQAHAFVSGGAKIYGEEQDLKRGT